MVEYGEEHIAFHAHAGMGIQRIAGESIQRNSRAVKAGPYGIMKGIEEVSGRLVAILDVEKGMSSLSVAS